MNINTPQENYPLLKPQLQSYCKYRHITANFLPPLHQLQSHGEHRYHKRIPYPHQLNCRHMVSTDSKQENSRLSLLQLRSYGESRYKTGNFSRTDTSTVVTRQTWIHCTHIIIFRYFNCSDMANSDTLQAKFSYLATSAEVKW